MKHSVDQLYPAAIAAHKQGRAAEAARLYDAILKHKPDHAGALHLKGVLALQAGQYERAIGLIERSLKIMPQHGMALSNLGVAYRALERYGDAIVVLKRAVELNPNSADALGNLGQTMLRAGQVEDAVTFCRRALVIDPNRLGLQSALLFAENYVARIDPVEAAVWARKVGSLIEAANPARTSHDNDPDPARRLRVGLVSGDLRSHAVGRFLKAVLAVIDPQRLELFAYATTQQEDGDTALFKKIMPNWLNVTDMPDGVFERRIVEDRIDVLVDLSGHSGGHRLNVFARKPAPVAFTWLGYFATTGLGTIDYVLANKWVVPEREEGQFTERVWRMPDTYLCFTAPPNAPEVAPLPARERGSVSFGSFNNFNKLSDETLRSWAALLQQVPDSRLILRSSGHTHGDIIAHLKSSLEVAGIDLARVRIDPRVKDYAAHLRSYGEIDIALDTFPYNGGTTTVEALYMGVPVLVRAGDRYVAHMGESILHNVGLANWIAADAVDYARLGAQLASDREALAALRAGMRARMLASPLFDAPRFARNFEDAVRGMWRLWCETQAGARTL